MFYCLSISFHLIAVNCRIGAVNAEIEHLLNESNIRNPGYFVFTNTSAQ